MSEVKEQEVRLAIPADLTPEQQNELIRKFGGWRPLIINLYRGELSLKSQALNQREKTKMPTAVQHIASAEVAHIELGKVITAMKKQRVSMTEQLDALWTRLMEPEKDVQSLRDELAKALIPLKQEEARIAEAKRQKELEVQTIIATIKQYLATMNMEYRSMISTQVTAAYDAALANDRKPETIQEYIDKNMKILGPVDFNPERPDIKLKLVTPEEAEELFNTHFLRNPHAYVNIYQTALRDKFADYEVAYKNKADALALSAQQAADEEKRLKEENDRKQLASQMEAQATTMTPTFVPTGRKVQEYNVVDMPNTMASVKLILAAYIANEEICAPHLSRITKPLDGFTASAAGRALAAVKDKDPLFQPSGIIFKKETKL